MSKNFNESEIIACKHPGDLFSSPEKMEGEYDKLAKTWHPDKPGGSHDAMAKINELYQEGKDLIRGGVWKSSIQRLFTLKDGPSLRVNFLKEVAFEIGTMYICDAACIFVIEKEYNKYISFPKFKFPSQKREEEFSRYLPRVLSTYDLIDGRRIVAIDKPQDVYSLRGIHYYYGGTVPSRHVAWILSSLYNLCCFLRYNRLVHNGINIDSYFICPEMHSGMLIGGWWYHTAFGKRMKAVPSTTYSVMTSRTKSNKKSDFITDLECVKLVGRTLLGSPSGSKLYSNTDIPGPMLNFLRTISSDDAVKEYKEWGSVLTESFGPRRFVEMNIDRGVIYPQSIMSK